MAPRVPDWLGDSPRAQFVVDFFRDLGVILLMAAGSRGAYLALGWISGWGPSQSNEAHLSYVDVDTVRWAVTAFDVATLLAIPVLAVFNLARFVKALWKKR